MKENELEVMQKYYGNFLQGEFPVLIQMFEDILSVKQWGFQQTFMGVSAQMPPTAIYDSEWCRVRFMLQASDRHENKTRMTILYGRRHAPIDKLVTPWNGEQCHCWHGLTRVLYFLDGLSPREILERQTRWPDRMEQFEQSSLEQEVKWSQPEWLVRMHSFIWVEYGRALFEMFDISLSRPLLPSGSTAAVFLPAFDLRVPGARRGKGLSPFHQGGRSCCDTTAVVSLTCMDMQLRKKTTFAALPPLLQVVSSEQVAHKALSERPPKVVKNASFFSKISTFCLTFVQTARRSLVKNDRLPSLRGASAGSLRVF